MSNEKPSLADILHENRVLILVILGLPVLGMAIAFVLILYKNPDNMLVVLGVIFFIAVQYIITIFFWVKKVEKLAVSSKNDSPKKD